MRILRGVAAPLATSTASVGLPVLQQAPGLWRLDMQQHDLSVPGREMVQQHVEIGPEASPVRHTHPGEEIICILEGSLEYQIESAIGHTVGGRRVSGGRAMSDDSMRTVLVALGAGVGVAAAKARGSGRHGFGRDGRRGRAFTGR
jgi:hypothetical protein